MPGVAFPLVTCHADGTRSLKPCRSAHSASSAALRSFRPIQLCNAPPHNHISRLAPSNDALAGHGIAFLEGDRFAKRFLPEVWNGSLKIGAGRLKATTSTTPADVSPRQRSACC